MGRVGKKRGAGHDRRGGGRPRRRVLLVSLLGTLVSTGAAGAESATWHGPWQGLDLYVTVITRGHPISRGSGEWWRWGNTSTDAYLFGFGNPGVDLVLDFSTPGNTPHAAMFVVDREQREKVEVRPGGYRLPTDAPPRMTLQPLAGGWRVGGQPNFNLRGTTRETVSSGASLSDRAFGIRVGSRVPGVPAWITSLATEAPRPGQASPRFGAAVQSDPRVKYELAPPLLPGFPYLSARSGTDFYGPNRPALFEIGRRELLNRFVGFQTAGIYAFNSYAPPPDVAFEAPFAWYRFDDRIGNFPNLVVRVEQFPRGYTLAPIPQAQRTAIRMSWTGADFRRWRYSLTLAGNHVLGDRVQVGDQQVFAVPYAHLPGWVTSRPWRAATFVEATRGQGGTEGIYSYSVAANPALFPWLNGLAQAPPDTFRAPYLGGLSLVLPNQLPEGYRGEYHLAYNRTPRLYASAIDRRVHLEYAEGGLWNLGGGYVLRTHNLTAGRHINAWLLERVLPSERASKAPRAYKNRPLQSLFALGGHLLYSDSGGVVIRQARWSPEVPLPTPDSRAGWQGFLKGAGEDQPPRDPRNLRGWLRDFAGPTVTVPGGTLRSLRVTPGGFRFVLTVPGGTSPSRAAIPTFPRLGAGEHVLTYTLKTGRWTAEEATPAAIRGTVHVARAREFEPGSLTVTLRNTGTLDRSGRATLLANGVPVQDWDNLTVPGGGSTTRRLTWSPARDGTARFAIRWQQGFVNVPEESAPENSGNGGPPAPRWQGPAVDLGTVQVRDTPRVEGYSALALSSPQDSPFSAALLLGLLALVGYSLWRVWGHLE